MLRPSTLRPGLLVSLKTSLKGNVVYRTQDIDPDHVTETGERLAVWQTERTVTDPTEHENAVKARGRASNLIRGICAKSAFGLLCPESKAEQLECAMSDARMIVDEFNRTAKVTQIAVYTIIGRVAQDDAEAIRAINSEVRDLLAVMEAGVKSLDVKAIREAAVKAKSLGQMLTPVAQAELNEAIQEARRAASRIVELGEQAALEIDAGAIRALTEARVAFLDLDASPVTSGASTVETPPEIDMDDDRLDGMGNPLDGGPMPTPFDLPAAPSFLELDFEPPAFMQKDWPKAKPAELETDET